MRKPTFEEKKEIDWSAQLFLYCVAVEWFLYGIYVVLFCFCVKTLRRSRVRHRLALFVAISVIFVFCTLHWILQLVNAGELLTVLEKMAHVKEKVNTDELMKRWNQINIVMGAVYVTSNLIADSIFVYRCYCIWGFRRRIIAVPVTLLIASGCLGYASVIVCGLEELSEFLFINIFFPLAVVFSVLTNVMLMALTAGRIWWIARGARAIMGPAVVQQYRTVIAMILESGALYCIPGLLYLITFATRPSSTQVIFAALTQIVGIAPTIIVVRVGLGNSVDSVDSFRAGGPAVQGSVLDIRAEVEGLDYWDGEKDQEMV
ncbi:hypothetical protein MVEN_01811600 [Mycena venus]|uniref:Uncharacterized protein n=1 Tax=Mycena venus TaxID=2733690 RepID=A0A8H7CN89_9AGAR|nr:hypothetical protein MVEN_01811600 [Mycena venus]